MEKGVDTRPEEMLAKLEKYLTEIARWSVAFVNANIKLNHSEIGGPDEPNRTEEENEFDDDDNSEEESGNDRSEAGSENGSEKESDEENTEDEENESEKESDEEEEKGECALCEEYHILVNGEICWWCMHEYEQQRPFNG